MVRGKREAVAVKQASSVEEVLMEVSCNGARKKVHVDRCHIIQRELRCHIVGDHSSSSKIWGSSESTRQRCKDSLICL